MSTTKQFCPYCGESWFSHAGDHRPPSFVQSQHVEPAWQPVQRRAVGLGAAPADTLEYHREAPAQKPTGKHFLVPFAQALVCGLAALLLATPVAIWQGWPAWSVLIAGMAGFVYAWLALMKYFNSLLRITEHVIPDKQPAPAQPEVKTRRVRLEIQEDNQHETRVELPIDADKLATVAKACLNGRPFSVANMAGRGKPLTRAEYETLRDWLLSCDYLRWVDDSNRQAGVIFTKKGEALLRALAS